MSWFAKKLSVRNLQSLIVRFQNARIAFEIIKKFLLFGAGPGSFMSLKTEIWRKLVQAGKIDGYSLSGEHIHCDPIEIISELGIVGFVLWFYVIISNINNLELLPLFIVLFVCSLFYFPLKRPHTGMLFWALLGLMSL